MLTEQNYNTNRVSTPVTSQMVISGLKTRFIGDQRPSLTVDEFISQHSELWSKNWITPFALSDQISAELRLARVQFDSVLDAIALVRAFTWGYDQDHWAVVVNDHSEITALAYIPYDEDKCDAWYFIHSKTERRALFQALLSENASQVVLFTNMLEEDDFCSFLIDDEEDVVNLEVWLTGVDVELIDYIIVTHLENLSYVCDIKCISYLQWPVKEIDDYYTYRSELSDHYVHFNSLSESTFQVGY